MPSKSELSTLHHPRACCGNVVLPANDPKKNCLTCGIAPSPHAFVTPETGDALSRSKQANEDAVLQKCQQRTDVAASPLSGGKREFASWQAM